MFDTSNIELQTLIEYFARINNCTVYVNKGATENCYIVQLRKNGRWSHTKRLYYDTFTVDNLIKILNELYEELIKGEPHDTDGRTD